MRRSFFIVITLAATTLAARAATPPPYIKLAQALGTPVLADSYGTPDKSELLLKFVARGESLKRWTKMTTVSIRRVPENATAAATGTLVARTRSVLVNRRVKLVRFDKSGAPPSAYFEFEANGERDHGVIYSPHAGFVTLAQISAKSGGSFSSDDVRTLRGVIGRR